MDKLSFSDALCTVRLHNERLDRAKSSISHKLEHFEKHKTDRNDQPFDRITNILLKAAPDGLEPAYIAILCDTIMPDKGILNVSFQAVINQYQPLITIELYKNTLTHTQHWLMNNSPIVGLSAPGIKAYRAILCKHLIEGKLKNDNHIAQRMQPFFNQLSDKPQTLPTTQILKGLHHIAVSEMKRKTRMKWVAEGVVRKALACDRKTAFFMTRLFNLMPRTPL